MSLIWSFLRSAVFSLEMNVHSFPERYFLIFRWHIIRYLLILSLPSWKSYLLSSEAFERYWGNLWWKLVNNDIREQDYIEKA